MLTDRVVAALRSVDFRGKLRLLDPLIPKHGIRSARVFGSQMELDLADDIQRNIYLGTYEPIETQWVRNWLKPGMCVVDVGANVGYFSALAADCVGPSGRVISIEPQPTVYQKLESMMKRAQVGQTTAFCGGLSETSGSLALFLPVDETKHNATMVAHRGAGPVVSVPVTTLDECIHDWGVREVDLLKIDVEGHEASVFKGAQKALAAGHIRAVLCEFNEPWLRLSSTSQRNLYDSLLQRGFVDMHQNPDFSNPVESRFFLYKQ